MTKELAYLTLYNRCKPIVYRIALQITGDSDDANDLTTLAFLRICKKLHLYKRGTNFNAWISRLSRNMSLRYISTRKHNVPITDFNDKIPSIPSPETELIRKESKAIAYRLLNTLSEDRKQLLMLKFIEKLSNLEIANMLKIPEGTVKSRINRTLHKLQLKSSNLCQ